MALARRRQAATRGLRRKGLLLLCLLAAPLSLAHHGWDAFSDEWMVLEGEVSALEPGNPHTELTLMVESEQWLVELGQPWRNRRAGVTPAMLEVGTRISVQGYPSVDEGLRQLRAVRVVVGGRNYDLYPGKIF